MYAIRSITVRLIVAAAVVAAPAIAASTLIANDNPAPTTDTSLKADLPWGP
jgi:hypothetical protein